MIRGLIGALFLAAIVVHFFWWIVAAIAVVIAYKVGRRMWAAQLAADEAERQRQDELRARADRHLMWWRAGDPRGLYGPAGAELMREIR
jgi:NhaP-type Na+/H+ or K+/H+ antiporter